MHEDIIEQKGETTSQMGGSQACYVPWHEIHLSTIMVLVMMVMTAMVDELLMSLKTDKKIVFFFQSIFSLRRYSFL